MSKQWLTYVEIITPCARWPKGPFQYLRSPVNEPCSVKSKHVYVAMFVTCFVKVRAASYEGFHKLPSDTLGKHRSVSVLLLQGLKLSS